MDKYKKAYKRLKYAFGLYIACLVFPFIFADMSGETAVLWLGLFIGSAVAYIYFLGVVVSGVRKSFGNWVGGAILFGPVGIIVTFFLFKPIAIKQGWEE